MRPRIFEIEFWKERTIMKTNNRLAGITTMALLVATMTINTATRAGAAVNAASNTAAQAEVTTPTTNIEFGGIKLGKGQNALIIVVCAVDETGRDQRPVDVEFISYDWDGNLLGGETMTIMPGHASAFDIRGGVGIPGKGSELLPCVKVLCDPSDPRAKRVTATLQISDDSGKVQSINMRKAGGTGIE
jgi:hypothetical protein